MIDSNAQLAMLFFIYAFLGWVLEVVYAAFKEGRFVNRGFLNGPICPIYGIGAVFVAMMLEPVADNLPLLFIGSMAVTTAIELLTGWLLERIFHAKWWDYSERKLNIGGYVCLTFSLLWGIACTFAIRVVHPPIVWLVQHMPGVLMSLLLCVFCAAILADVAATIVQIRSLTLRLKHLRELAAQMHALSDEIGGHISDRALRAKSRAEEGEKKLGEIRLRIEEIRAHGQGRILKAFPGLRNHHQRTLDTLLKQYKIVIRRRRKK